MARLEGIRLILAVRDLRAATDFHPSDELRPCPDGSRGLAEPGQGHRVMETRFTGAQEPRREPASTASVTPFALLSLAFLLACDGSPTGDGPARHRLELAAGGTGSGVVSGPEGIHCTITDGSASGACGADLPRGSRVTLEAVPAGDDGFAGWSGACDGATACTVTMDGPRNVVASFAAATFRLEVSSSGGGSGLVAGPGGISCVIEDGHATGTCGADFTRGTSVSLHAAPAGEDGFAGWSGACAGTGTCAVVMSEPRGVAAGFTAAIYRLEISGDTGSGHVTGPGGLDCTIADGQPVGTCGANFARGTQVTLDADPASGYAFGSWTEDGVVVASRAYVTLPVSGHRTLAPSFEFVGRSVGDRQDDLAGPQVRFMYVIPRDGLDRRLDVNGELTPSVGSFHNWFGQRTGGLAFRLDTHAGELDIGFHRLARTNAEMVALGANVVVAIDRELRDAGRLHPDKKYLVYYDGGSTYACGGARWPGGQLAAMYLQGTPPAASCGSQRFVTSATQFPRYWEFAALHDLVHILGIVATNAPHHTDAYPAHVPEQNDLMYSGPGPWIFDASTTVDVGGDDYFGPDVPAGVTRLTDSPVLTTVPPISLRLLEAPSPEAARALSAAMRQLPMHPPFPSTPPGRE